MDTRCEDAPVAAKIVLLPVEDAQTVRISTFWLLMKFRRVLAGLAAGSPGLSPFVAVRHWLEERVRGVGVERHVTRPLPEGNDQVGIAGSRRAEQDDLPALPM